MQQSEQWLKKRETRIFKKFINIHNVVFTTTYSQIFNSLQAPNKRIEYNTEIKMKWNGLHQHKCKMHQHSKHAIRKEVLHCKFRNYTCSAANTQTHYTYIQKMCQSEIEVQHHTSLHIFFKKTKTSHRLNIQTFQNELLWKIDQWIQRIWPYCLLKEVLDRTNEANDYKKNYVFRVWQTE